MALEKYGGQLNAKRIYFALRTATDGERKTSAFSSLMDSIRTNKGITQPITVVLKGDKKICIDGNSRLAIYKDFLEQGTLGDWSQIKALAHINKKFHDFKPAGLQKYLESRDEKGTEEATTNVKTIQRKLFDYVIGELKKHYGTENKVWWTEGVPLTIRQECAVRWEAENREGEQESQLYLINYINICHNNWGLFKDVISLDVRNKDNKKANTKWIKDLNEIRKITAHPERGVLTTEQVAFVNELSNKVNEHFPEDIS